MLFSSGLNLERVGAVVTGNLEAVVSGCWLKLFAGGSSGLNLDLGSSGLNLSSGCSALNLLSDLSDLNLESMDSCWNLGICSPAGRNLGSVSSGLNLSSISA